MSVIRLAGKVFCAAGMIVFVVTSSWAAGQWEKEGNYYFLTKDKRDNFSATGAGANKFISKYMKYDGVSFLVRGADDWKDYGRLNLEGNNLVSLPIRQGMKVDGVHFLAGGNYGNSYEHDAVLNLYGDKYFYAVISVIFVYQDGSYKQLSVPVFWDWFRLGPGEWSQEGAKIKSLGSNPVRKDCSIFHISFTNPKPEQPLKDILLTDSWLRDKPFSEIFAVTLQSSDAFAAAAKEDRQFKIPVKDASKEPADTRTEWMFNNNLDGWISGSSQNWDADASWQAESFGRKGAVLIPACNWGGDKFSWIDKKISLPDWEKIILQFLRHSAVYSELDKSWNDGLLKVLVKNPSGQNTVYEKLYSGEWSFEKADLSRYRKQTVIIRFENHGAGNVRLTPTTSPTCDAEDAVIDDIRLICTQ